MALPKVGVQLVLEGASSFFADLKTAQDGLADLGKTTIDGKGFDGLAKGAKDAADGIDRTGKAANDAGSGFSALREVGIGALRELGAAAINVAGQLAGMAAGFLADSVTAAGDFEASVNNLAAVSGTALAEAGFSFDDVSAKALQLGADTRFSASESIAAMTELVKGGVPVAEVMDEATQATLDLAAAAGVDLTNAAEIVAKQFGVWQSTGIGAGEISDLLTQAANASTVGVEDLALGLANVGGVAKVTGLDFGELTQTMALIAPGFSSAADAGTSLKTFLTSLNPATKPAREAMYDLGLYTEETGSAFFDASGNFVGMETAAQLLQASLKDLTAEQQQAALKAVFGQDAFRAAAIIAEQGAEGFNNMGEAMAKAGTAAEVAAIQNQGWNFVLDQVKAGIETLQIAIGTALLPVLVPLAERLSGIIGVFGGIVGAVTGSRVAFDGLPTSIQNFLAPLLGMSGALASTSEAVRNASTPLLSFKNIFDELPAPLQSFIAFVQENWQPILAAAGGVLATILVPALFSLGLAFAGAVAAAAPVVAIGAALGLAFFKLAPAFQSLYTILSGGNGTLGETVGAFAQLSAMFGMERAAQIVSFATAVKDTFEQVRAAVAPVVDAVGTLVSAFFEAGPASAEVQAALGNVGATLAELGGKLVSWVQESLPGWIAGLSEMGAKLGDWVMEAIPPLLSNLLDARNRMIAWVLDSLPAWASGLGKMAYALYEWVLAALPGLGTNLGKIAALLLVKTGELIGIVVPKLFELGTKFIVWIGTEVLPKLPGELVKIGTALLTGIGSFLAQVLPPLLQLAGKFITWVGTDVIPKLPGELAKIGRAIVTGITGFIAGVGTEAGKIGKAIIDGMVNAVKSGVGQLTAAVGQAAQNALNSAKAALGISSPSQVFADEVGQPISQGIAVGIAQGTAAVMQAGDRLLTEGLGTAIQAAPAAGAAVTCGIAQGIDACAPAMTDAIATAGAEAVTASAAVGADLSAAFRNYFAAVADDGDVLNDFLTHLPESARAATQQVGQALAAASAESAEAGAALAKTLSQYFDAVVEDGDHLNDFLADLPTGLRDAVQAIGSSLDTAAQDGAAATATLTQAVWTAQGGIATASDTIATKLGTLGESVASLLNEGMGTAILNAPGTGQELSGGIALGIERGKPAIEAALRTISAAATKAGKAAFKISSPSQLFADEVGQPIIAGVAAGILDNVEVLLNASAKMGAIVLSEAKAFAKTVQDALGPLLADAYKGAADYARSKAGALADLASLANVSLGNVDTSEYERLQKAVAEAGAEASRLFFGDDKDAAAGAKAIHLQLVEQRNAARVRVDQERAAAKKIFDDQKSIAKEAQQQIKAAQQAVMQIADPAERAAAFNSQKSAILETAKLRQQIASATTAEERANLEEQLAFVKEAQAAEFAIYATEAKARQAQRDQQLREAGEALKQLGNLVYYSQEDVFGKGEDLIKGLIKGAVSQTSALKDALGKMLADALAAMKKQMGISSPSKVFALELGMPIGQGVVAGATRALGGLGAALTADLLGAAGVAAQTIRPALNGAQRAQGGNSSATYAPQYNYSPTYQGAPRQPMQDFAIMKSLNGRG